MTQTTIPFLFLRGGTSRGPYFLREDLQADEVTLARMFCAVLGAGHRLNIDEIGGGAAVTTKAAILSKSTDPRADVGYFFTQVQVTGAVVDFWPTCGNMTHHRPCRLRTAT